jgi:hypothetical protein
MGKSSQQVGHHRESDHLKTMAKANSAQVDKFKT